MNACLNKRRNFKILTSGKTEGLTKQGLAIIQTDTTYFKLYMPDEDYVLIC